MLGSLEARELGGRRSPRTFKKVPRKPPGDQQEDPRRLPGRPGNLWEAPGRPLHPRFRQEAAGDRQETARKAPGSFQDGSTRVPGGPKRDARSASEAPKRCQEPAQESPNAAPDANTTKSMILKTLSGKFVLFRWSGPSKMGENWPQNVPRRKQIAQETPRESR